MQLQIESIFENPMIVTSHEILRQKSDPPDGLDNLEIQNIVELMKRAMKSAWVGGVACSAIQIGLPIRLCVYFIQGSAGRMEKVLINPRIVKTFGPLKPFIGEGCLSIPRSRYTTWRFDEILVEHTGIAPGTCAKYSGFEAQIIQHEIDHMDGILCCDRGRKPTELGRNDFCSCGSNVKYKKCCGRA